MNQDNVIGLDGDQCSQRMSVSVDPISYGFRRRANYYFRLAIQIVGMPHGQDVEGDTSEIESEYECLQCGLIVEAQTHPGECPECGGDFHNRAKSLE